MLLDSTVVCNIQQSGNEHIPFTAFCYTVRLTEGNRQLAIHWFCKGCGGKIYFTAKLYNTLALPVLLYSSETWTVIAKDARRITAADM